jgi:hypothetical protein
VQEGRRSRQARRVRAMIAAGIAIGIIVGLIYIVAAEIGRKP